MTSTGNSPSFDEGRRTARQHIIWNHGQAAGCDGTISAEHHAAYAELYQRVEWYEAERMRDDFYAGYTAEIEEA